MFFQSYFPGRAYRRGFNQPTLSNQYPLLIHLVLQFHSMTNCSAVMANHPDLLLSRIGVSTGGVGLLEYGSDSRHGMGSSWVHSSCCSMVSSMAGSSSKRELHQSELSSHGSQHHIGSLVRKQVDKDMNSRWIASIRKMR